MSDDCCQHEDKKNPWYRSFFLGTLVVTLLMLGASFIFSSLEDFRVAFFDYSRLMILPIVLGFVVGGMIDYYIPQPYVSKHLSKDHIRTVFYSVGLGFVMSACSHGILALSMELHKKGASGPAVISFLLASPWANLPITFLLIGFFGAKAFVIILGALVIAVNTGFVFQFLDRKGWIEKNRHTQEVDPNFSIRKDVANRFRHYPWTVQVLVQDIKGIARGSLSLTRMVGGWLLLGVLMAAFSSAFIPHDFFNRFFGPSFLGLSVTLIVATVLEVCSEGTSPLAFEIYKQTGALGNAFAFLMGGVVTDYTEIGLVWANIGRRTALWMVAITIPQVLILGMIFNIL